MGGRYRLRMSRVGGFRLRSVTLTAPREVLEAWRHDYNERRPHSKLGWLTPQGLRTSPYWKRRAACCAS